MDPNEWSVRDPEAVKAAKIAEAKERALGAGRAVADAPSGEEIVISGIPRGFLEKFTLLASLSRQYNVQITFLYSFANFVSREDIYGY